MYATLVPNHEKEVDITADAAGTPWYDVYRPHVDAPAGILRPPMARPVVDVVADDRVIFDVDAMETGRPYTYRLGGEWLAAVKRPGGQVEFFALR